MEKVFKFGLFQDINISVMNEEIFEYGYMEGGVLHSRFLSEFTENWVDEEGIQHAHTVTVEEQLKSLSSDWKPVDKIFDDLLDCDDPDYIIIPVPYDAGEHIGYKYIKKFDVKKVCTEIQELKDALTASDYRVMKCYEASLKGEPLPYDIELLTSERQAQRERINELEAKLENNADM